MICVNVTLQWTRAPALYMAANDLMYPRALGVLAGNDMPFSLLKKWAHSADIIFAADAGLDRLLEIGVEPAVVIGDFDSVQGLDQFQNERVHDRDENSTDCDKLLKMAGEREIAAITLASVEGDQLDHMLATLHSAARSPLKVRIALRRGMAWILNAGDVVTVETQPGRRVSMIPLEEVRGATIRGVKWPLEDADLHPSGMTAVSNLASEKEVKAAIGSGAALLFVSYPEEEMPLWE